MAHTNKLKYRTYDQLIAEVQSDFRMFNLNDFMNPQEFIKVAKRCNYDLGFKLFSTKEEIIEVEKGKARLPNNFNVLNFAFVLSSHSQTVPVISGTHVESVPLAINYNPGPNEIITCAEPVVTPSNCNSCGQIACGCNMTCNVRLNCKGEETVLIQRTKFETRRWSEMYRLTITNSSQFVDFDCPNKQWNSKNKAYIKNNFIFPSFPTGKIYLNYQSSLEDDEGNLLVPDHDLLNEYYEYAIKQRILENMIMNGEVVNQMQIQLIEKNLKAARNNALTMVNTPDFNELRRIWETNRKAQFSKYFKMFKNN